VPRPRRVVIKDDDVVEEVIENTVIEEVEEVTVSTPAMVLSPDDLRTLSSSLSVNIRTKADLMQAVKRASTVNVQGQSITIEAGLLQRIKSRCLHNDFPRFLEATIKQQLHTFVGW
jgi:hypothetical protein